MKKLLLLLLVVLIVSSSAIAQSDIYVSGKWTSSTTGQWIPLVNISSGNTTGTKGIYNHRLIWASANTIPACSVSLQYSVDGINSAGDLIAAQNCATNSDTTATGYVNYVRISVTMTTGRSLYVGYSGLKATPAIGAITVVGSATEATLAALNAKVTAVNTGSVTVASSALPTGASTSALQGGGLPAALGAGGGLKVDGSGTALPVSGTVTANAGTGTLAVSAASLPLPTGAATSALQGAGLPAALGVGGGVKVDIVSGAGSGGTAMTDDAAFTIGSTSITPSGGTYKSVRDAVDDGDAGAIAINAKRGIFATLEESDSTATGIAAHPLQVSLANTAANTTAVKVDNSAVTQPVSGTFWQATQPISGTVTVGTFPDNEPLNVAQINGVTPLMGNGATGTGSQRVTVASDNTPFAIKTDQTTHGTTDKVAADLYQGAALVSATNPVYTVSFGGTLASGTTAAMTATTTTAVIAGTASNYTYITQCTIVNSHATVGTLVTLEEETSGTDLYKCYAAAAGGGCSISFPAPLKIPTVAKGINALNGTTGSNTYASCAGFKSTVSY